MDMIEIAAKVTAEELPGDLSEVAGIIGVRHTLNLTNRFRGTSVYFHNMDAFIRKHRNKTICKQYEEQGVTVPKLAREYRLSERQIWKILGSVA